MQYKFYKELKFAPVRAGGMFSGRLVYETIKMFTMPFCVVRRILLQQIVLKSSFGRTIPYFQNLNIHLVERQHKTVLEQVICYIDWSAIKQAEVDISLVKSD